MKLKPDYVEAHRRYAAVHRYKAADPHLRQLRILLASADKATAEAAQLNFALGKAFEDIGEYDQAFAHFSDGNQIIRSSFKGDFAFWRPVLPGHCLRRTQPRQHRGSLVAAPLAIECRVRECLPMLSVEFTSHGFEKG